MVFSYKRDTNVQLFFNLYHASLYFWKMAFKSGFINIIGLPNAGKSTLMNELVGERLCIISPKAQTTRHRILAIVNKPGMQAIFSDTPGLLEPRYALQKSMQQAALSALEDADLLLIILDGSAGVPATGEGLPEASKLPMPKLILLNKIDLLKQDELNTLVSACAARFPGAEILPLSALHKVNLDLLWKKIEAMLPEGPAYYDEDQLTDRSERFFVSEIIREKILLLYEQEIPYSSEVVITDFLENTTPIRIRAEIFCNRESQKAILIGEGGKAIKRLGIAARKDIEKFLAQKVHLDLHIKVYKDWRNDPLKLKRLGYQGD